MGNVEIEDVPLSNLLINPENFRFDIVSNQREAIRKMVEDQGEKILNLAEDIVEVGLNPSKLLIVMRENPESNMFIIQEGNRRITALKLLSTPNLLELVPDKIKTKIIELGRKFNPDSYKSIKCVIYEKKEDTFRWVKLEHTGENDGVGTVGWDAQAVARFNQRIGIPSIALQAIEFVMKITEDESYKEKLRQISITNLDRLLTDPDVRNAIGLDIKNGQIITNLLDSEIKKGLLKITKDLVENNLKVTHIYHKKDREKYIESFSKEDLPNRNKTTSSPWSLVSYDEKDKPKPGRRKRSSSASRKALIPRACIMRINVTRINNIYIELKNININKYPNAISIMIRVFLELSLDQFIKIKKIPDVSEDDKLSKKLTKVVGYFKTNNFLTKNQLRPVQIAVSKEGSLLSPSTLNAYVHNMSLSPIPNDLKLTWESIQEFIEKIWDEIEREKQ